MNTSIFVDLGQHAAQAERGRERNEPACAEEEIDDVVLADHDRDQDVRRRSRRNVRERQHAGLSDPGE